MEYIDCFHTDSLYCVTLLYLTGESLPEIAGKFSGACGRISELKNNENATFFRRVVSLCRKATTIPGMRERYIGQLQKLIPEYFEPGWHSIRRVCQRFIASHLWCIVSLFPKVIGFHELNCLLGIRPESFKTPLELARRFDNDADLILSATGLSYEEHVKQNLRNIDVGPKSILLVDGENNRPAQFIYFCQFMLSESCCPDVIIVSPEDSVSSWQFAAKQTRLNASVVVSHRIRPGKSKLDFDLYNEAWSAKQSQRYDTYILMASDSDYSSLVSVLLAKNTVVVYSYMTTARDYVKFLNKAGVRTVMLDTSVDSINTYIFSYRYLRSLAFKCEANPHTRRDWLDFLDSIGWSRSSIIAKRLRFDLARENTIPERS